MRGLHTALLTRKYKRGGSLRMDSQSNFNHELLLIRDQIYQSTFIVIRDTVESLQCLQITWVQSSRTSSHLQSETTEIRPLITISKNLKSLSCSKSFFKLDIYIYQYNQYMYKLKSAVCS